MSLLIPDEKEDKKAWLWLILMFVGSILVLLLLALTNDPSRQLVEEKRKADQNPRRYLAFCILDELEAKGIEPPSQLKETKTDEDFLNYLNWTAYALAAKVPPIPPHQVVPHLHAIKAGYVCSERLHNLQSISDDELRQLRQALQEFYRKMGVEFSSVKELEEFVGDYQELKEAEKNDGE